MLIYAVGPKYLTTAKRLVDSIRVNDAALPILVAHASGVEGTDGALYFGTIDPQTRLVGVANFVTEHTRRAKACVLIHGHNLSAAPARHPHRPGQVSPAG